MAAELTQKQMGSMLSCYTKCEIQQNDNGSNEKKVESKEVAIPSVENHNCPADKDVSVVVPLANGISVGSNSLTTSTTTVTASHGQLISEGLTSPITGTTLLPTTTTSTITTTMTPTTTNSKKQRDKDYVFGKVIGEGSFSTVFLVKDVRTAKQYAMKVCDKVLLMRERKSEYVKREREALCRLNSSLCPFMIRLYATFQDEYRLFFVLSYAKHGELLPFINRVGSFNEECTRFYAAEVLVAMEHMHRMNMIHRDIKPENILLDEKMHVQLADFGSVRIQGYSTDDKFKEASRRNSFVGTAQYVAPEILSDKEQTKSVDLWSFGCTVYQMTAGYPPFRAPNEYLIFQKVMKLEYSFPDNFNPKIKGLVEKLLVVEPSERLGASDPEVEGYLSLRNHPFFVGLDFDTLHQQTPPPIAASSAVDNALGDGNKVRSSVTNEVSDDQIPDGLEPGLDDRQLSRLLGLDLRDYDANPDLEPGNESDVDGINNAAVVYDYKQLTPDAIPRVFSNLEQWLAYQATDSWHERVSKNVILKMGLVSKRKGILAKPRLLILTTGPHLYYFSQPKDQPKGEIAWGRQLKSEAKNFKLFVIRTPSRSYYLEDHNHQSQLWCDWINALHKVYFPSTE